MIKGSIKEKDITLINLYSFNIGASKYIKQILTDKKGIDGNTIIVRDFNTPLTSMDRSSRQNINQATKFLNDTIEQLDLIDMFRTLHPKQEQKTKKTQGTHSFQEHTEHSLGLTTYLGTKLTSTNLRV